MNKKLLAIATCCKNDGRYMAEWLAFYSILGADAILVYNNESTDETAAVLRKAQQVLPVEILVKDWATKPGISPQLSAFADAIESVRGRFEFLGLFDSDEFLVPQSATDLRTILAVLPANASAVAVNQRVFGSSGRIEPGEGLVVSRFVKANKPAAEENQFFKSIGRVDKIASISDPHYFNIVDGNYVDACGRVVEREGPHLGRSSVVCEEGLRVNHYMLKSLQEFLAKRQRGGGASSDANARMRRFDDNYFYGRDTVSNKCEVEFPHAIEVQLQSLVDKIQSAD